MNLKIDEEFHSLIAPLSQEEYKQLEANIVADGCREAISVWDSIVLDGHNRLAICQKHNIGFTVKDIASIKDRADAKIWIIKTQLGRRNIGLYQRAQLALKLEPLVAKKAKENKVLGGKNKVVLNSGQAKTSHQLASINDYKRVEAHNRTYKTISVAVPVPILLTAIKNASIIQL